VVYLLTYFRTQDEALHLAWSEDALSWSALNGNQPVLRATVGNHSVRDPFIRRCEDGYYHLLSTDSWWSPNLLHARSADLLEWEPWTVLPAMGGVAGTRNAWAPEFFFDAVRGISLVFWASITADRPYQRIWFAETSDFRSLTPPAVLFDPGYSVIDATLVEYAGTVTMIYKDERGENAPGTGFKAMRVATAPDPRGPYTPKTGLLTPPLTEGPAVFRVEDRWRMLYDFFTDDRWGASESEDLLHWHPVDHLSVPPGARHGSVFSVPREQLLRLQSALNG
jgi:glycosyl hydrolase family 43